MKLTIERLKTFYSQLRKPIDSTSVIIAGGSVRDALNGRDVKDLDVYVQLSYDIEEDSLDAADEIDTVVEAWNKVFFSEGKCISTSDAPDRGRKDTKYGGLVSIKDVWHWKSGLGDLPVDLIFVNRDPALVVKEEYDFGICQAWVGHYGLKTLPAYWSDSFNRTITYLDRHRAGTSMHTKSREHAARILAKYPGWRTRNILPLTSWQN